MSIRLRIERKRHADVLDPPVRENKRIKIEKTGVHDGHRVDVPSTLLPSSAMAVEPAQNQREITQLVTTTDFQKMENLFFGNFPQNAPQPSVQPQPQATYDSESIQILDDGAPEQLIDLQLLDDEPESESDQTIDPSQDQQRPNTPEIAPKPQPQGFRNIPLVFREHTLQPAIHFQTAVQTQKINDDEAPLARFSQSMDYGDPFHLDSPHVITKWLGNMGLGTEKNAASLENSFVMGCSYLEQKNYSDARKHFTQALKQDPEQNALLGLASCDFHEGKYSEAIERLKPVLDTSYAYAAARFKMGFCFAKQNKLAEAIEHFKQVPHNYSFYSRAQYNIGCLYYNQKEKDFSNAINHFKNVSQNTSKFNAAQYYLGLCFIAKEQLGKAEYHLGQIKEKSRYFSDAQAILTILERKQN